MLQFLKSLTRPAQLACLVFVCGCATTGLFISYPVLMQPYKTKIDNNQFEAALTDLNRYRSSSDKVLMLMERGRVAQIANKFEMSKSDFNEVIIAFKKQDERAVISATDMLDKGVSLLTSEKSIEYQGYAYERVFIHQFQALNYLFSQQLESALVEVRRANQEQQYALERYQKELDHLGETDYNAALRKINTDAAYISMQTMSGKVKNSFQNAYSFYTSGLIYEISGLDNDAFIDYKKALEIFPDNIYLQKDILRLAKKLGMDEQYQLFKKIFKITENGTVESRTCQLVVLFEQNFVPVRHEFKLVVPWYSHLHSVAFPLYKTTSYKPTVLQIAVVNAKNTEIEGNTSPIVDVKALAVKALEEAMPFLIVRQLLRIAAKNQVLREATKKAGPYAELSVSLYNIISEQADLRSWLTLPEDAQIYKSDIPSGDVKILLSNQGVQKTIDVTTKNGSFIVLRAINTGTTLHTSIVTY